jgi:uncharacterized membrane protein YqgA involved in biofilm formation
MAHLRNVLGDLWGRKGNKVLKVSKARTASRPKDNFRRNLHVAMLLLVVGFVIAGPAQAVLAQTSGSAPTFNATVQGESASTVEGTLANVVNYVGNVMCPIGAGLMVAATVVQAKTGKSWVPSLVTAGGLLAVSGVTRLIETMVLNGQSAVK